MKTIAAAEFKAKCLAIIDRVHDRGEPITITKRGKVVARLVPAGDEDEKPWLRLRGLGARYIDPFRPVFDDDEYDCLK